jgi:steroid delta-isomerase-like uncharacterized protein
MCSSVELLEAGAEGELLMFAANKAVVERYLEEAFNRGDATALHETVAPGCVVHDPLFVEPITGTDGRARYIQTYRAAFSSPRCTIRELLAEGNTVVARWEMHGLHNGPLAGIAPTGRQVTLHGVDVFHLAEGKIVESWSSFDTLGLVRQLGMEPEITPEINVYA